MCFAVISGQGPILLNWHVGRYIEAVGFRAVQGISVLVFDRNEIKLARAETLDADVGVTVGKPSDVDRISIWFFE